MSWIGLEFGMTKTRKPMTAKRSAQADAAESAYRAALARLIRGEGRHPSHAGRVIRITPASVAREAGRSRNPLYTTHRDILEDIEAATTAPGPAKNLADRIAELEATIAQLKEEARRHAHEKRALASENLLFLHRARTAEDRLSARESAASGKRKHTC